MIDYVGELKRIDKCGWDWFHGASPHVREIYSFINYINFFRSSGHIPQFARDFDVLWLQRPRSALGCAFEYPKTVLSLSMRKLKSPNSDLVGESHPVRKRLKVSYNMSSQYNSIHSMTISGVVVYAIHVQRLIDWFTVHQHIKANAISVKKCLCILTACPGCHAHRHP